MRATVLAALLLAACTIDDPARRTAALNALVGQSDTVLLQQWGVPTRTYQTGDGTFLAYDSRRLDIVPGVYPPGAYGPWPPGFGGFGGIPPTVVESGCETTFQVTGGHVAAWWRRGPAC